MTRSAPPHIIMVSWKGPRHPHAGGAERYTERALAGLSRHGMRVTWLVPRLAGFSPQEMRSDGVEIRRLGTRWTHPAAAIVYLLGEGRHAALVIDQINTYPMGTLLVVPPARQLLLIHQLARTLWFLEAPLPLALPGWLLEPVWLWLHRRRAVVTVSSSTALDLRRLGFRDISVVPIGVDHPLQPPAREPPSSPLFVALGRFVRMKRLEHVLQAFELVRRIRPDARLVVIGRGDTPYAQRLMRRVTRTNGVDLLYDATEVDKQATLAAATALVATSVREGWGIMVTEAHALGTPSIAYDVPGLRDSTRHGVTGLLTAPTPSALAEAMLALVEEAPRWRSLSRAAAEDARCYDGAALESAFSAAVQARLDRQERPSA